MLNICTRMKDQRKCMVHFEDKGMFPKVHWRILEDSGRFLDRIPRGLGFYIPVKIIGGVVGKKCVFKHPPPIHRATVYVKM